MDDSVAAARSSALLVERCSRVFMLLYDASQMLIRNQDIYQRRVSKMICIKRICMDCRMADEPYLRYDTLRYDTYCLGGRSAQLAALLATHPRQRFDPSANSLLDP